jgi:hypothetical protein
VKAHAKLRTLLRPLRIESDIQCEFDLRQPVPDWPTPDRQRAADLDAALAGGDERFVAQHGAQGFDFLGWPVREIGQCASADLAVLALAFVQQNCGRRGAVGNGCDMHALSERTDS